MKRICLILLFALCVLGPAQAQVVMVFDFTQKLPPPRVGKIDSFHTVAVLSAFGDTMTLLNRRFIGSRSKDFDIAEWKIDDQVAATLRQYLGGRFTFKDVPYDRAALAKIPNGPLAMSAPAMRSYLETVPKDGIDAFIVVRPSLYSAVPGLIGLALENGNGDNPGPTVWANYEIEIVDTRSLNTISEAYSRVRARANTAPGFAGLIASDKLKLGDELTPDASQREELRNAVYQVMPVSLLETLRVLETGAPLPDTGSRTLVPMTAEERPFPAIRNVGIVSAIGNQLQFEHHGGIALTRRTERSEIANWQVDERIETQMRELLGRQFTVKDVAVDRDQLTDARLLDEKRELKAKAPGLSPTADVDAYLVVVKHPRTVSEIESAGVGLMHYTPLSGGINTGVFANYAIALVNAQTLRPIVFVPANLSPKFPSVIPYKSVDKGLWPERAAALSPAQSDMIREELLEVVTDSVEETLLRMRLSGMKIANAWPVQTQPPADASLPPQ